MFRPAIDPEQRLVSDPSGVSFGANSDSDTGSFLKPTPRMPDATIRYPTTEVCGTPYYMAPEQHYGEKHSFEVDFWGMGVTLYRMLTNRMGHKVSFQCDYCRWDLKPQMPFGVDAVHKNEMAASVARDPLVFEAKDGVDQTTQAFLRGLLAKDPRDRLSLEEIKTHPYFDGIEWEKVLRRELRAPWKPFVPPVPKRARKDISTPQDLLYDSRDDPFPQFTFNTPVTPAP